MELLRSLSNLLLTKQEFTSIQKRRSSGHARPVSNTTESKDGPRKFLIVDDHTGFRKTLRAFLPPGRISECDDGLKAIALYGAELPDWVLMDFELQGMDGLTATRHLLHRFPQARVIFVSNHADDAFRDAAMAVGAYGFVSKQHLAEVRRLIDAHDFPDRTS